MAEVGGRGEGDMSRKREGEREERGRGRGRGWGKRRGNRDRGIKGGRVVRRKWRI